jgi:SpoVK/Ycf46/Vps4 family AAA+-type ATPase
MLKQKMPPIPEILDSVRKLVVAHAAHDESGFAKNAESIVRELTMSNRPSEAKALRDALALVRRNGNGGLTTMQSLTRSSESAVTLLSDQIPREQLFFRPETQKSLDRVILEHRSSQQLAQGGLHPKRKLLFWGPPGCGKTAAASLLAAELGLACGIVRLSSLITSYVGETASNVQKAFAVADSRPMILLFDEADAVAKARGDRNDVGELRRVVNSLLQALDYFAPKESIVVLASNHSHTFDSAIWRRFDDIIEFPRPGQKERESQLRFLTGGLEIQGDLCVAARKLVACSYADIQRAVREVAKTRLLMRATTTTINEIVDECISWRKRLAAAGRSTRPIP